MKKKLCFFLVPIIMVTYNLSIQATDIESRLIKFEEYITIIKEKLPELTLNANGVKMAELGLKSSNSRFDVSLESQTFAAGQKIYTDSTGVSGYGIGINTSNAFKAVLPSGTILSLGADYTFNYLLDGEYKYTNNLGKDDTSTLTNYVHDPVITVNVVQPLVYNWFGFLDRFSKKDATMKLRIERLKQAENDRAALTYYKKLYFTWILQQEMLNLLATSITNAETLEAQTRSKMGAGIAENDDLQKVRYQVFKYREQYRMIENYNSVITRELNLYFDTSKLRPDPDELNRYFDRAFVYDFPEVVFEETRGAQILNLSREQLQLVEKVRKNQTMPQLNFIADLDIKFHVYEQVADNVSGVEVKKTATGYGNPDFSIGLQFSYPLRNIGAKTAIEETRLMIEDIALRLASGKNRFENGLTNIKTNVGSHKDLIDLKKEILDSLKSRYKTENQKYQQVRLDLAFLIDTANTITNEEIELLKKRYELIGFYLDYLDLVE